jgi:hypothetical protein
METLKISEDNVIKVIVDLLSQETREDWWISREGRWR